MRSGRDRDGDEELAGVDNLPAELVDRVVSHLSQRDLTSMRDGCGSTLSRAARGALGRRGKARILRLDGEAPAPTASHQIVLVPAAEGKEWLPVLCVVGGGRYGQDLLFDRNAVTSAVRVASLRCRTWLPTVQSVPVVDSLRDLFDSAEVVEREVAQEDGQAGEDPQQETGRRRRVPKKTEQTMVMTADPFTFAMFGGTSGMNTVHGYSSATYAVRLVPGEGGRLSARAFLADTAGQSLPPRRSAHAAGCSRERKVMAVFGGWNGTNNLGDCWVLDLVSREWRHLPGAPMPSARRTHCACSSARRNAMFVFGGYDGTASANDLWQFSFDTLTWTCLSAGSASLGPCARGRAAMVADDDADRLIVIGGWDRVNCFGDVWEWDLCGMCWTEIPTNLPELLESTGGVGVCQHSVAMLPQPLDGLEYGVDLLISGGFSADTHHFRNDIFVLTLR